MANEGQRQFIDALIAVSGPGKPADRGHGPILAIPAVDFRRLPTVVHQETKDLIVALNDSQSVYDKGAKNASRSDGTIGAMRQIHTNNPMYLPRHDITGAPTGRAGAYHTYVLKLKGHTHDRENERSNTGYVEYTAGDNQTYSLAHLSEMRIVYDYLNHLIYLAPFHYQGWTLETGGGLSLVDKPTTGASPFFWIIEVTKKI